MGAGISEITIIGGGVVGLSVALGLVRAGHRVTVLDGSDSDLRASQGNFGLVWLQGKGADFAPYCELTRKAVAAWPGFATLRVAPPTGPLAAPATRRSCASCRWR